MRFTVRRPASAEVSPCCHRPSGGDVACGVHVCVARPRAAGDALENRLALAVFRRDMPAVGASLRRVRCRDKFQPSRSFVLQSGNQQSPPLAVNLTVEASFLRDAGARALTSTPRRAGHSPHVQILDADRVEAARQIGAGLFHPVTAAICLTGAQPGNGQLRSCPPVRSAARSGQAPLQSAQPLGFTSTKARGVQQLPGGQGTSDGSKSHVPAPRAIQSDAVRLHGVGDVAGPPEPNPSDFRYPDLSIAAAEPLEMARFEPDLPKSFMLAGLAPRRAAMGAVEKVAHRLREVPQRLLLDGLRPGCQPVVFGAGRRQLSTLLVVAGRLAARLPLQLLLHGQIPHKPGMATMLGQCRRLLKAGKQPKPAHTNNLGRTTDNLSKGGGRRFLPRIKPSASTPQI